MNDIENFRSGNIAKQMDSMMAEAARGIAGPDGTIYDLARRGNMAVYPDGSEVFSFDGVPLLKFWPVTVEHTDSATSLKTKVTRRYQRLAAK